MGNSLTSLQQKHCKDLVYLLNKDGHHGITSAVGNLVKEIDALCPWYPEEGTFKLSDWDKIGKKLQQSPRSSVEHLHTWSLCRSAVAKLNCNILLDSIDPAASASFPQLLAPLPPDKPPNSTANLLPEPPPQNAASLVPSAPPLPPAPLPEGSVSKSSSTAVQNMAFEVLQRGDSENVGDALALVSTFPVIRNQQGQRVFESVPFAVYKELKKSINENGMHSSYTLGLLDGLLGNENFIPQDWKAMLKAMMPPAQYVLFLHEWRDLAQQLALENLDNNVPVGFDMLVGEGPYSLIPQQLNIPRIGLQQVGQIVKQAWLKIPSTGTPLGSFATIRQAPTEDFMSFVNKLQRAIERQVSNPQAAEILLKQLSFENSNSDAKSVLIPIYHKPETGIAEMIKACQNIGTESHKSALLAAAIKTVNNPAAGKKCFSCGKQGHFSRECRLSARKASRPSRRCPKCNKGFHWANQCRADQSGNSKSGPLPAQAQMGGQ